MIRAALVAFALLACACGSKDSADEPATAPPVADPAPPAPIDAIPVLTEAIALQVIGMT